MSLKSTIYKANLQIADIDHSYYATHALTLARHPSETDERMMIRLVALAFIAHELQDSLGGDGHLSFGAGLADPDEPDVLLKDYTGANRIWCEVGQPEEKPLSRACSKADRVEVFAFAHSADVWWKALATKVSRLEKLKVRRIPSEASKALVAMAERSMQLSATLQEGSLMLSNASQTVTVEPLNWQ
jgi:uncharacterized protein YaeQ